MNAEEIQNHGRLLVIDDEPTVLKLVKTMLTRARYDVVTASSGAEALRLLDEGWFDVVITDAIMPAMSGYELVQAIRKHPQHAGMPVLMLTRKRDRQDVKHAMEAGVSDYVLKPIDEHLLLDKVGLCLKKGQGKRQIFELPLSGEEGRASLTLECVAVAISETDITVRVPVQLGDESGFQLAVKVLADAGVTAPNLKLVKCEPGVPLAEFKHLPFEAKFGLFGIAESDMQRIRAWIQREVIRRRK